MNAFERMFSSLYTETHMPFYGVHRWKAGNTDITSISSPGWASFTKLLPQLSRRDTYVVSPEIITATELNTDDVLADRALIEERISYVKQASLNLPRTVFLLGTPLFHGGDKPTNSMLYLKAGEVIGSTNKRSGVVDWEKKNFSFVAEEPPSLIPGSDIGVLICADLGTATIYARNEVVKDRTLELGGRENLIGTHPQFIQPDTKTLIVPSCWGIGGNQSFMDRYSPDIYYLLQLRTISSSILRDYPQLDRILVVDRCPDVPPDQQSVITSKPLNVLFQRK